jgi:hypothetical protein
VATNGAGGYTVHRPDHWLFAGTGIDYGDLLGAAATVVGYECDGCDFTYRDGLPVPDRRRRHPEDFEILGTVPGRPLHAETAARPPARTNRPSSSSSPPACSAHATRPRRAHRPRPRRARLYTSPGGGTVVTSGSTDWAHGLAGRDPQVEQITRNVLDRLWIDHATSGQTIPDFGRRSAVRGEGFQARSSRG